MQQEAVMAQCYICGTENLADAGSIFSANGPQDMLNVTITYWEEEQPVCDVCRVYLVDVVFLSRHGEIASNVRRLLKAWERNKKNRRL
jgi:hypothetical protein